MRRVALATLGILAATVFAAPAMATDLALWTFETSLPTGTNSTSPTNAPLAAEGGVNAGAGSPATGVHANAATDWSNPVGNGSAESFSVNTWETGDYFQFSTSTVGYTDIEVSWDQARSGTGPDDFTLLYSLDNVTYTALTSYVVLESTTVSGGGGPGPDRSFWTSAPPRQAQYTFGPIAGPASLDNQSAVYFRLRVDETPSAGGTNRVDNFLITGVPEPTSLALMLIGGAIALRRRQK